MPTNFPRSVAASARSASNFESVSPLTSFMLKNGRLSGNWPNSYTGAIPGTPANQASGTVRCSGVAGGITFEANGTWQMTRIGED